MFFLFQAKFKRANFLVFLSKLTAGLLVFLFLVAPLRFVLADEINTIPPQDQTTNDPIPQDDSEANTQPPSDNTQNDQTQAPQVDPNVKQTPQNLNINKPVSPDEAMGALLYNYPLTIPAGRNNVQPDLQLSYNSQTKDFSSFVGQAWSLNIPSIQLLNKNGIETMYSSPNYSSSLSDELVSVGNNNYGAKVDGGDFAVYNLSNSTWVMKDKSGTTYTFGATAQARQDDPNNTNHIYKWMLEEVHDTNDNYIRYEYYKNNGQIYPSKIFYTGNGLTDGIFEIDFLRETRSDITTFYKTGFLVKTNYRINEVTILVNGSWVKKYVLNYQTADNVVASILHSITTSGRDDNGMVTTLPADVFKYQTKDANWSLNNGFNVPAYFATWAGGNNGAVISDINNDGLPDIVHGQRFPATNPLHEVFLNKGDGTGWGNDVNANYNLPVEFGNASGGGTGAIMIDVNNDGLSDVVYGGYWYVDVKKVYLNNGNGTGWTENPNFVLPITFANSGGGSTGAEFVDVNGDGLPDIVQGHKPPNQQPEIKKIFLNKGDGTGWGDDVNANYNLPVVSVDAADHDTGVRFVDVNGDGLTDIVHSQQTDPYGAFVKEVYINKGDGTGWTLDNNYIIPKFIANFAGGSTGVQLFDINSDGLVDLVYARGGVREIYINKGDGTGWALNTNYSLPVDFIDVADGSTGTQPTDINGDGMIDFVRSRDGSNPVKEVYTNNNKISDLLYEIDYGTGGSMNITYKGAAEYRDGSGNVLNPNLPQAIETVSSISQNDGAGQISTTNYSYEGGQIYYNNARDIKFAGFSKITKTDSLTKTVSFYHQGNTSNSSQGEYQDHVSKIGKMYRQEVYNLNGNLFSKMISKWDKTDLGNNRNFVKLIRTVQAVYDGNTSHKDSAETYDYNNTTGNKINVTQWGEVSAADNGDFTDLGTDKFTNEISYATGSSNNVIGLPATEITNDQNDTKIKESRYYYDNLPLGQVSIGNQTKQEEARGGFYYISIQKDYNSYGLVTIETDPLGRETNYTYDTYNLYPVTVTNPANQTNSFSYDYSSGKVTSSVDVNGKMFSTYYDGLDRPVTEMQPDPNALNSSVVKSTYEYTDISNANRVKQSNYLDVNNIIDSYTYFDGLGRKVQERREAENTGEFNVRDFIYTQNDLLLKESLPYFSSGSARTVATTTLALYTIYNYDAMKRVISAQSVVGTTTNNYDDWTTTVTDAKGKVKNLYKDAYGNLVQVDEHNGSSVYSTYYQWNNLKKLTKITDALGNVRNFIYDGLGRVLAAEDLHAVSDSTFGIWYYAYDDASNLTSKTAPNTKVTAYTYDNLNRALTEDAVGTNGVEVTYTYDNCQLGIGRLCSVVNSTVRSLMSYNSLGQLTQEVKRIGKINYPTQYDYDRQGNQILIISPDDSQVVYNYNAAGLVDSVQRKEATDSGLINVISNIDYNSVGLLGTIVYGNGVVTTNTYDSNELYRLRHKVTVADNQNVQDLTYTYDPVGNITQIVDVSSTQTAKTTDYTYDDLHRLLSATISNSAAQNVDGVDNQNQVQTFTYDAIGNILTKSDVGTYSYNGNQGNSYANPHAVTTAGNKDYTYDENGNVTDITSMTVAESKSFLWDYGNRLVTAVVNGAASSYAYDASGQRIKEVTPTDTTLYPTKEYSTDSTGAEKHIFLGDTAITTVKGSGEIAAVYNIHADHLTGSNVITDASQKVDELTDYYSFGTIRIDQQNSKQNEKRKFTGHEYDTETGLTYANARYYDAHLGRFLSQDPVTQMLGSVSDIEAQTQLPFEAYLSNPQNFNSYTYAINNPLKYNDPTGGFRQEAWHSWQGFVNSVFSNYAFGYGRVNSNDKYIQAGQVVGDISSMALGAAEIAAGIAMGAAGAAGGIVLSPTGVGAVAGVGVSALGIAAIGQGVGVAGSGAYHFSQSIRNSQSSIGNRVSSGHAYDKHVLGIDNPNGREFGSQFKNRAEFGKYVDSVVKNPSDKFVKGSRGLYWDDKLGTIVIDNPQNPTAFRPTDGKAYYNREVQKLKLIK